MTTDIIQDKKLKFKAQIDPSGSYYGRSPSLNRKGFELTKMETFLDGRQDIFDLLENHAANSQMSIKNRLLADQISEDHISQTPLFQSLWSRLKTQMNSFI